LTLFNVILAIGITAPYKSRYHLDTTLVIKHKYTCPQVTFKMA
jgi:hypothetical protein